MTLTLAEITPALLVPFALEDIGFLPKNNFEQNGQTVCLALPFADKRCYEDRLNAICPGEWTNEITMLVAGSKIIASCKLTICGISHSDVGEAALSSENAATEAYAQAFKRACSQFGLGRYLYELDKAYLPYDKAKKRIDLDAPGLKAEARKLYIKAGLIQPTPRSNTKPASTEQAPLTESAPASTEQIAEIRKICKAAGKRIAKPRNAVEAAALIAELQAS